MRQINLLPDDMQQREKSRFIQKTFILVIGISLAIGLGFHYFLAFRISALEERLRNPEFLRESPKVLSARSDLSRVRADVNKFIGENRDAVEILNDQFSCSKIFNVIGKEAAEKIWVSDMIFDSGKRNIQIKGKTLQNRMVSEFMLGLKKAAFFQNVELISMGKEPGSETEETQFQIVCQLK